MKSDYPDISDSSPLKSYKKLKYVKTGIGYLGARYDSQYFSDKSQAVYVEGLQFKTKKDWYNYLKQFPNVKVPADK